MCTLSARPWASPPSSRLRASLHSLPTPSGILPCVASLSDITLAVILLALARLPPSGIPPLLPHAHRHPLPGWLTTLYPRNQATQAPFPRAPVVPASGARHSFSLSPPPVASRVNDSGPSRVRTPASEAPFPRFPVAPASLPSTVVPAAAPVSLSLRTTSEDAETGSSCVQDGCAELHQAPFPRHPVAPASLVPVLALPADDEDDYDSHTSPHRHRLHSRRDHDAKTKMCGDRDTWPTRTPRYVVDPTQTDPGPAGGRASTREALLFSHLSVLDAMLILPQIVVVVSVRPSRRLFLGVDSNPTLTRHTRPPAPSSFTSRSLFHTQPLPPVDQSSPVRARRLLTLACRSGLGALLHLRP
ncbi:hypothetical protein DFH09DRAFT_1419688 [Mycena vulgaris]|nr:hypothetical protein DFH09DRAFT_1419688 [Mycena vulgaris]